MSSSEPHRPVRRRTVFYIPGYDPMPPRAYRERYRREAARQAEISGHDITLRPFAESEDYGWRISARIEAAEVETTLHVLVWSDLVRGSMSRGVLATYLQLLRTVWIYLSSGAFFRLMRLRKGPVIAALYPVAVLLGQLMLAVALGGSAALGVYALSDQVLYLVEGPVFPTQSYWVWRAMAVTVLVVPLVTWAALHWFRRRDDLLAWYLMHDFAFAAGHNGAYPPELESRLAVFTDRIAAALREDVDEVLIVGHSSGAYLAVSALADLLRSAKVADGGPALSLLTLGHVVPMVSFLPKAARLRTDLAQVSETSLAAWVDVSAPGDGCAFALCDPVAVSGVAGAGKRWPLVLSAAFSRTLSPKAWAALRWRFFERHFQYLNAFDALSDDPGRYDYFAVTAGPKTLAARFEARRPSASRIETAVSRYTDLAA